MRRRAIRLLLMPLVAVFALHPGAVAAAAQEGPSLYERMGGYDVIAAFVDDFFTRFGEDPELAPYLGGINAAEGARVHQHFVDFVCARTGGPCLYNGRDMSATHEGLGITGPHFDAVIGHMEDALEAQNVPAPEREELLAMLRGMKSRIVGGV